MQDLVLDEDGYPLLDQPEDVMRGPDVYDLANKQLVSEDEEEKVYNIRRHSDN